MRGRNMIYIFSSLVLLSACYYDKEELLYPPSNSTCDSIGQISYVQQVSPLLLAKCGSCHSAGNPSGGIAMGTYSLDKAIALNGKLMGSIEHKPGFTPMPQGLPRLTTCEVAKIRKWIDNGTLNN